MKVIKQGKPPIVTRQTSCPRCQSVLEYEKTDLHAPGYYDEDGSPWVECPICKQNIRVGYWQDYE